MLNKRETTRFSLLGRYAKRHNPDPPPTPTPTIPVELICRIVDDHLPFLIQENGRFGLRGLAHTCRFLSAYCRPLLLHTITLHGLYSPFLASNRLGITTRPERFSKLIHTYPDTASFIKELHIILINPYPSRVQRMLKRVGVGAQRAEMKSWQALFSVVYAQLTTLHVIISWRNIPPELVNTFLQALQRMPCLRALELDGHGIPLVRILQSCPSTLKHFGVLGGHYYCGRPSGWTSVPPKPICDLESLTLHAHLTPDWVSSFFISKSPLFNLENLRHIQITPFNLSGAYSKLRTLPSQTLQCIHIHLSRNPGECVLSVSELKALTHIEVVVDRLDDMRTIRLLTLFNWLEQSLETLGGITPQVAARLSSLTICILLQTTLPDAYDDYFDTWHELTTSPNRSGWKRVGLANTYGFFSRLRLHTPTDASYSMRSDPPRLLSAVGEHICPCSYQSLWGSCLCSGWKGW
ncbi:hypothetical protein BKA70DRAFT_1315410 [Coprinopsis sp. MPI-PUGE-AT-0042]|nr:hypothetical protein BKA70DRAFT_1315410 [Coprinopsis sp. MPI-PUGE-AT-0042]